MAKDAVYHRKTKYDNLVDDPPARASAVDGISRDVPTIKIPVTSDPTKMNTGKSFTGKPLVSDTGQEYVTTKPNPFKATFKKKKK